MSKRIYALVWKDKDGTPRVDGYWNKPLSEKEQHGFFKEHYPALYDPENVEMRGITWELVELKRAGNPVPLPNYQWAGFKPEF